jgi:DnaJ domain
MDKEDAEKNAYEIVGVDLDATDADIKKAFRQRSLKTHPDRVRRATLSLLVCSPLTVSFALRTPVLKMQVCDLPFSSNRSSKY